MSFSLSCNTKKIFLFLLFSLSGFVPLHADVYNPKPGFFDEMPNVFGIPELFSIKKQWEKYGSLPLPSQIQTAVNRHLENYSIEPTSVFVRKMNDVYVEKRLGIFATNSTIFIDEQYYLSLNEKQRDLLLQLSIKHYIHQGYLKKRLTKIFLGIIGSYALYKSSPYAIDFIHQHLLKPIHIDTVLETTKNVCATIIPLPKRWGLGIINFVGNCWVYSNLSTLYSHFLVRPLCSWIKKREQTKADQAIAQGNIEKFIALLEKLYNGLPEHDVRRIKLLKRIEQLRGYLNAFI